MRYKGKEGIKGRANLPSVIGEKKHIYIYKKRQPFFPLTLPRNVLNAC